MWDGIDLHRCRILGLRTAFPIPALAITHYRPMGSSHRDHLPSPSEHWGRGSVFHGDASSLYILAITAYRTAERPWMLGLRALEHFARIRPRRRDRRAALRRSGVSSAFASLAVRRTSPASGEARFPEAQAVVSGMGTIIMVRRVPAHRRDQQRTPRTANGGRCHHVVDASRPHGAGVAPLSWTVDGGACGFQKGLSWAGFAQVVGLTIRLVSNVILAVSRTRRLRPARLGDGRSHHPRLAERYRHHAGLGP